MSTSLHPGSRALPLLPALFALLVLLALFPAGSARAATDDVVWLCHPSDPGPCGGSLETTVRRDGQSDLVENPPPARSPKVDCFYVYPTASDQLTLNAERGDDPAVEAITRYQAQRFSRRCAVYVPSYRQVTVPALLTRSSDELAEGLRIAYPDVRDAWLKYWREENRGKRPFILIGHSQGSGLLTELIREKIDGRKRMRKQMLSAILPGVVPTVPAGETVGGDFENVPTCERRRQRGCVMAWATYDEVPPPDARYGVPNERFTEAFGWYDEPDAEAICTNPARLKGGAGVLKPLLRTEPIPGLVGAALLGLYELQPPLAPTPWIDPPDRYRGECVRAGGAHYLDAQPIGGSQDLRPSPDDTWGLHIADVNIALGNLDRIVRAEKRAARRAAKRGR